jgi:hypothetical protein
MRKIITIATVRRRFHIYIGRRNSSAENVYLGRLQCELRSLLVY